MTSLLRVQSIIIPQCLGTNFIGSIVLPSVVMYRESINAILEAVLPSSSVAVMASVLRDSDALMKAGWRGVFDLSKIK